MNFNSSLIDDHYKGNVFCTVIVLVSHFAQGRFSSIAASQFQVNTIKRYLHYYLLI